MTWNYVILRYNKGHIYNSVKNIDNLTKNTQ